MSLGDVVKGTKTAYRQGASAARWVAPVAEDLTKEKLDDLVEKTICSYTGVRKAFKENPDSYDSLRTQLEYAIMDSYQENFNLRKLAGVVDTADKALVPVGLVADYLTIVGGVGHAAYAGKELIEMPPKLAYMAYYVGKTGDFIGALGDLAYEGLSFFLPGGNLLDLTNRYANKADKYILKSASSKFIEGLAGYKAGQPRLAPSFG